MNNKELIERMEAEHVDAFTDPAALERRKKLLERVANSNPKGQKVQWRGRKFVVFPTVFWPCEDSSPLLDNYVIHPGESVCDVCTGSGVIAIDAAYKGASKVVALDINPQAVRAATVNAYLHAHADVVDVRKSDVLSALRLNEEFDVITINPPLTFHCAGNSAEAGIYDRDFHVHSSFFYGCNNDERSQRCLDHLNPKGRIYIAQSNFGNCAEMLRLADSVGFDAKLIGETPNPQPNYKFYAFELRRR